MAADAPTRRKAANAVYVHGVAITIGWADERLSLGDLIFNGVSAALADAKLSMAQMESVVLASHDLVDGRSLSSMVTAPPAGAYLRDEIRLSEDGLAALSLAAARVEAGECEYSVVAAWGRASEGDFARISRRSFDPAMVQPFAVDEFGVSAMRLSAWLATHGPAGEARSRAGAVRERSAAHRRLPTTKLVSMPAPLMSNDAPRPADIMVAAIVGRASAAIRIAGVGHGTDLTAIGDRDLKRCTALADAAAIASGAAGIAPDGFDLYELDGATLADEALAVEAVGVAAPGQGFAARATDPRINRSGGGAAGWAYPANGLLRFADACLQMRGEAGAIQLPGRPRTALATGLSTVAGQAAVVVALEAS